METNFYQGYHLPLAFYIWTDTLLLNAVKVKLVHFPDLVADLFILKLSRISWDLVSCLEREQIFRKIICIEPPFEGSPLVTRQFLKLFSRKQYKRIYTMQLKEIAEGYAVLFTGALWSESIMLFQYLKQYSPTIEIQIIEEGTANYCGIQSVIKCDPLSKFRDKLIQKTRYSDSYQQAVYAIKGMYLAFPKGCIGVADKPIYPICECTPPKFYQLLSNCINESLLSPYRFRRVIFFLQPERGLDSRKTLLLLQAAVQIVGPENLVVRPHPDAMAAVEKLKDFLAPEIYWETAQFPFEYVLYTTRWDAHILISKGSSCLFYPRYLLQEEPTIIFTNRLYKRIRKKKEKMQLLAKRLETFYHEPEKVFQPEKIEEFKNILRRKLSL